MLNHVDRLGEEVSLEVQDGEGRRHHVAIGRRGPDAISGRCSCEMFGRETWCRHLVDTLCMRLRALGVMDGDTTFRMEELVMGSTAEDHAHQLDRALIAYERARETLLANRVAGLSRDAIDTTAMRAAELAETAAALSYALTRFKRVLAGGE